jgi:hypothetical protein
MEAEANRRGIGIGPWAAVVFSLGVVAALIVVQLLNKEGKADTTTLGLLLIGVILLFAAIAPAQAADAIGRITKLKLGAVELGLKEIKRAERVRPVPGEEDGVSAARPSHCGYAEIVEKLQGRLRFVRQILEFTEEVKEEDDYHGIASWLREHGLLQQDEEAFVLDLLDGTGADLPEWEAATRKDFLDAAFAFSVRFGPKIWDRWVRRGLTDSGWFVAGYEQDKGHRPDFLAFRGGLGAVMTARVAGDQTINIEQAGPRLLSFEPRTLVDSRVIVIPDIRRGVVDGGIAWGFDRPDGVRVLKFGELKENPDLAFASPEAVPEAPQTP